MKSLKQEEVAKAIDSDILVLIEFWSPLCKVCDFVDEYLLPLEKAYKDKVDFFKIDLEKEIQLVDKFSVSKLPTFVLFKNSSEISRVVGFKDRHNIERMIRQHI